MLTSLKHASLAIATCSSLLSGSYEVTFYNTYSSPVAIELRLENNNVPMKFEFSARFGRTNLTLESGILIIKLNNKSLPGQGKKSGTYTINQGQAKGNLGGLHRGSSYYPIPLLSFTPAPTTSSNPKSNEARCKTLIKQANSRNTAEAKRAEELYRKECVR